MKVLVVDDSEIMRQILVSLLKKWDYEVVVATDGAEAWRMFQEEPVPLVLTDWMMPEMDGLELIRRIRGANLPSYVYIVLLTARGEKEDLVVAMEAGADDFVAKPIDPGELRVRVREGERIIRLERSLAEQNRQLRETQAALVQSEKLASLGQLAAGMAHEINNPVAFVTNNLAVLKRDVTALMEVLEKYRQGREQFSQVAPQMVKEAAELEEQCDLEWIRESLPQLLASSLTGLTRVRKIVGNLRDFARLDEAEVDELDVNAAVRSTLEMLRHEVNAKNLRVTTEFSELPPILSNPHKINQVFHNLLLNAIQFSQSGGAIELRTYSREDGVVVEIEDHGCGIGPVNLARMFEPFFTTKPVGKGAGLGLAISYGIVRNQGGTINVDSELGRGSTFRVWLPWQPPRLREKKMAT